MNKEYLNTNLKNESVRNAFKEKVSDFDAVLISTNHSSIDYAELAKWSECIVDTRNALNEVGSKNENHIFKA